MIARISAFLRRLAKDERGSSTVEFVIIFTPLIMLIFLILQVSISYHWALSAQKGVEMAARMASVQPPLATNLVQETGLGTFPINRTPEDGFEPGDPCVSGACAPIANVVCSGAAMIAAVGPLDPLRGTGAVANGCSVDRFLDLYNEIDRFAYQLAHDSFAVSYVDSGLGNAGQPYIPLIILAINPDETPVVLSFFSGNTATWSEDSEGNATATIEQRSAERTDVQMDIPQIIATIVAEDLGI
ncbi:pilus assembly protein [Pontivivens ytuae]|uniref:Pilus assembly protein n=2 Tax=Pontivivens ytuae TaxID=2789856 RepID=A0A7S9QDV7_9RHOB|nr:pilus assembly protein [Pontivivens ytuae]